MSEVILKGIQEANEELQKENLDKLQHEVSEAVWDDSDSGFCLHCLSRVSFRQESVYAVPVTPMSASDRSLFTLCLSLSC